MRPWLLSVSAFLFASLISSNAESALSSASDARVFRARGVVEEVESANLKVIIKHEAVSNYMAAMTMPFKVKAETELVGLQRGDQINFQLHVAENESWVDHFSKIGFVKLPAQTNSVAAVPDKKFELLHFKFTNELGQAVSLSDFPGQALAITFFYTRCPLPDYCPRLSKNFQEASQKLEAMTNAPTNWHFLSVSFDPEFDSPEMLKSYGQLYQYDPTHWSFLTGPKEKIGELARRSGVTFESTDGTINHNFRTMIIDASGHLQMVFPTTGDLSDQIVSEILKATAVTNAVMAQK
jgi:protein SCO1